MVRSNPRFVWLIITAFVAMVVLPIFLPGEMARWYIAAGARALQTGDETLALQRFQQATKWDPDATLTPDFLLAQLQRKDLAPQGQFEYIKKLITLFSGNPAPALAFADRFAEQGEFELAYECVKLGLPGDQLNDASRLNQRAYFSALADKELDKALRDIEHAKELMPGEPALEDTHAWVLHKMGRNLEALGYANIAIKSLESLEGTTESESTAQDPITLAPDDQNQNVEIFTEDAADVLRIMRRRVGLQKWSYGVLRFHRLRIAEALKQSDIAAKDREWLKRNGIPISDLLF